MKTNIPICICIPMLVFLSCSPNKKTQEVLETKAGKKDVYNSIEKIAEALPMTQREAHEFFSNLDSIQGKSFRKSQGQLFQYSAYTVFYAQPVKGRTLKGVGIDLDSTSSINMEQLGKQLEAKWHSADLIEVKAGKIHYSADYTDSKKVRKKIRITISMAKNNDETENKISFIGIDMEPETASKLRNY
jgi:hypothetical protein